MSFAKRRMKKTCRNVHVHEGQQHDAVPGFNCTSHLEKTHVSRILHHVTDSLKLFRYGYFSFLELFFRVTKNETNAIVGIEPRITVGSLFSLFFLFFLFFLGGGYV